MIKRDRFVRKSYAMRRMAAAIERAIKAITVHEKDKAARWAAAWGLLCGIKTASVSVRRSHVLSMHEKAETCSAAFVPAPHAPHASESGQA